MTRELDALSDLELIVRAREGHAPAYGVLWKRHWHAARAMAASVTGRFEPDDLASEAFARILKAVEKGNGPRTGFRSYLSITIRNVAIDWSRRKATPNIEDPDTIEDWTYSEVTALKSIDSELLAQAFYALPESWQEVLWYTEVEDMAPREVAPILGVTPNAVSALAGRAREGLRQAWINAHLADSSSPGSVHAWTLKKLGPFVRGKLTPADRGKVEEHLASCAPCADAAGEAGHVGYRLALGILPFVLGIAGATGLPGMATPQSFGLRIAARLRNLVSFSAAGAETGIGAIGMSSVAATVAAAAALTAGAVVAPPQPQGQVAASASSSGSTSSSTGPGSGPPRTAPPPATVTQATTRAAVQAGAQAGAQKPASPPCLLRLVTASTPVEKAVALRGGPSEDLLGGEAAGEEGDAEPEGDPAEDPSAEPEDDSAEEPGIEPGDESGEPPVGRPGATAPGDDAEVDGPTANEPVDAAPTFEEQLRNPGSPCRVAA